jgi:regulator of protease activity HflC (stomatin/prohibitin superfamily)
MSVDPDPPESPIPDALPSVATVAVVALLLTLPVAGALAWEPVNEGNVKVVKEWGATTGTTFGPGAHFINPVSQSTESLSVRPQSYTMSSQQGEGARSQNDAITVLTRDGLRVDVDVTIRYRIDEQEAVKFYKEYRSLDNAEARLIRPSIRSVLRTEAGRLPVTEVYTGAGQTKLKEAAEKELSTSFAEDGMILEAVQVRNVNLPDQYAQAVEEKEITEQRRQQKQDELEVEKLEAERKRIEAEGQAEANEIVAESLRDNPELIQMEYVKALRENNNTVYVGAGDVMLTRDVTANASTSD